MVLNDTFRTQLDKVLPFIARDIVIDMVTRILVAVFCIASYRLFRKSSINPPEGLSRRMLLLPILMTLLLTAVSLCTGVLLIGLNDGYADTASPDEDANVALVHIQFTSQILVEYDPSLLIYLNSKMQSVFKEWIKKIFRCKLTSKHNRVAPLTPP